MQRRRHTLVLGIVLSAVGSAIACGSRTGLPLDEPPPIDVVDLDAQGSVTDTGTDTGRDASRDAARDATRDAELDALPPIDGNKRDASHDDCPDAGATQVYVLSQQNELFSFFPPTTTFTLIGVLACPATARAYPWSMTVDRKGIAYSVFSDGNLFRVDTATAACVATAYQPGQLGFSTFGMGYAANINDPGETLFVAENTFGEPSKGLGWIDTTSLTLHFVATFNPAIPRSELTGTADGRLFTFYPDDVVTGSHLAEVDKATAQIVGVDALNAGQPGDAFAFAAWGGDFYIFTSTGGPSTVTRFRPSDHSEIVVATLPSTIVGAGVSTCAPQ